MAFNPVADRGCANLKPNGNVMCVSLPDGSYTSVLLRTPRLELVVGSRGVRRHTIVPALGSANLGTKTNAATPIRSRLLTPAVCRL
ncbi:hypothetical protein L209DRAFT_755292, partial [Thermothelomyces heterothallicus CBS 203.75]